MGRNSTDRKNRLIVALCLLAAAPFADGQPPRPESQYLMLTVLVYNYSEASPAVLARAKQQSELIFSRAGIRISWTDCPIHSLPDASTSCYKEPVPGEVRVRILARPVNHNFQDSVFGFTMPPVWASVYFESAARLNRLNSAFDIPVILGCLMSHEIGHLLLGENRHTVTGIMKAQWELTQIQQAMRDTLVFTPEQAILMQRNAGARVAAR